MEVNYHLYFYVPASHLEQVKTALFEAGAGKLGQYSHCAWQTTGQGQFMPTEQANPFSGNKLEVNSEVEIKVEMICREQDKAQVKASLLKAHPYEVPAYGFIKLED